MANPHTGKVEVEIGGSKHVLSFSANALAELELALGMSMDDLNKLLQDEKKVRIAHWRTMFVHALQDNEDVDERAAIVLFKQLSAAEAISVVGKAYGLAFKGLTELAEGQQGDAPPSPPEAGRAESEQPTGRPSSTPGASSAGPSPSSGG